MCVSSDGKTLHFVVGPGMTIGALAAATLQAGAWDAIQLDINSPWARFDRIAIVDGKLTSIPILKGYPNGNRLIRAYSRDFFYITSSDQETAAPPRQDKVYPID